MQRKLMVTALLAGTVLAACGSDDSESSDTTEAAATDTTEGSTETTEGSTETTEGSTETTAVSTGSVAAECGPDSEALYSPGVLTVATGEPAYEPWVANDDPASGEGYESAFVYALAERIGFSADQVVWVRTTFDQAITGAEKDYDFNLQQYSITPDRAEQVEFSYPYYTAERVVMAMGGTDAASATTFTELREVTWAATVGTNDLDYIENVIGVDPSEIAVFNTQADTQAAMMAGQADATVLNFPSALYVTAVEMPEAVISGILPDGGGGTEQFGLIYDQDSPLKDCIDPVIEEMSTDGTLDQLAATWLAGDGDVPAITED